MIDIYLTMFAGATVWFADKAALQGTLLDTLLEARPTRYHLLHPAVVEKEFLSWFHGPPVLRFIGVPRVYEKMAERLQEVGARWDGMIRAKKFQPCLVEF